MSTEQTARGERTRCEECGLPYYADENDACPYCAWASTVEQPDSNARDSRRSRTTCDDCGLPYYAENDTCPYCADASREAQPSTTELETEAATKRSATVTGDADSSEREPSFLKRLSNKVRDVLGSV